MKNFVLSLSHRLRHTSSLMALLVIAALLLPVGQGAAWAQSPAINDLQVLQVLGKQLDDGKNYVAGKDTVVRVFLADALAVDPAQQKVVVKRDGAEVATLAPAPSADPAKVLLFTCASREACGDWKAGKYVFEATVNGATKASDELNFVERKPLRILAVNVKANYAGQIKSTTNKWKTTGDFTRDVYPIAAANFNWQLGQELDASGDKFNLDTDQGRLNLWAGLAELQPKECLNNRTLPNCYDLIVGYVPDRMVNGTLQGYTYGWPANVVVESDEDVMGTVAHEIAHIYGVGDEYNGGSYSCAVNPPPPDYVGREFKGSQQNFSCKDSKEAAFPGGSGSLIPADKYFPFDITAGRGALPDMMSFMGSGTPQAALWITPAIYAQLFKGLDPAAASAAFAAAPRLAALAAGQRFIYAAGTIPSDPAGQVTLEPWSSYTETQPFQPDQGAYSIEALDGGGTTLASEHFDVSFNVPDNAPLAEAPFEVALPFPEGTAKFVVKNGDTTLAEIPVSANAPVVNITSPTEGQTVDGAFTVTWDATDADNDSLHYDVEYSPDGDPSHFTYLAVNLTEPKWTDDANTLPGGDKAVIRITATDGVNATETTSPAFKVPAKPPEVFIDEPAANATVSQGQQVVLSGSAYDAQIDDWLTGDASLAWTSDKDGKLGDGELVYADKLSAGDHTLTLTATNAQGLTATATVKITVEPGSGAAPAASAPAKPLGGLCGSAPLAMAPLAIALVLKSRRK